MDKLNRATGTIQANAQGLSLWLEVTGKTSTPCGAQRDKKGWGRLALTWGKLKRVEIIRQVPR